MKKQLIVFFITLIFTIFAFPQTSLARIGVGISTGKIVVDEKLYAGIIYELPPISVINTGDEVFDYAIDISYHQNQPELLPSKTWFSFRPAQFTLQPSAVQNVIPTINLPLKITPGNYFAYLEAHPVRTTPKESTSVSIAAASKLYFTVKPSNSFQAIYYKIISFWVKYMPATNIIASILVTFILILLFKRFFNLNIQIKKRDKNE